LNIAGGGNAVGISQLDGQLSGYEQFKQFVLLDTYKKVKIPDISSLIIVASNNNN
jgi:hypothetical protein